MYEAVRTGAVGILFSLPALVVLTAVAMSGLLSPQVQKLPGAVRRTVLIGVGWTALFTLLYVLFLRHGAADPYVRYSLSETFLDPRSPRFAQRVSIGIRELPIAHFFGSASLLPPKAVTASVVVTALGLLAI